MRSNLGFYGFGYVLNAYWHLRLGHIKTSQGAKLEKEVLNAYWHLRLGHARDFKEGAGGCLCSTPTGI